MSARAKDARSPDAANETAWPHRHLLGIEGLSVHDIETVLDRAQVYFEGARNGQRKLDVLRGKTIINVFFEASTRTRTSFELAGKRLGADVVNVSVSTSSVSKGETLVDTAKNLEAMHSDILVLRHSASGAPHMLAKRVRTAVVNAGDGLHEHPTQALLDAFTIRRAKGTLRGLTVAICGDILNSRVARSNAILLRAMGANVRFAAPRTLLPRHAEAIADGVVVHTALAPALEGADVVMMLRIQNERLTGARLASTRE